MKKDKIPVAKEHFSTAFNITESSPDDGTFKGIAAAFGTRVDTWCPTVIAKGAFTKTIKDNGKRFRILNQHDTDEPLARPGLGINPYDILAETELGLMVGGKISKTSYGMDCITLLRDRVIDEMSIGHDPIRCENMPLGDAISEGFILDPLEWQDIGPEAEVRVILETRLWEASLVTWGANRGAMITDVHATMPMQMPPDFKPMMMQAKGSLKQAMEIQSEHIQDPKSATMERQAAVMGHMQQSATSVDKCMGMADKQDDAAMSMKTHAAPMQMPPDFKPMLMQARENLGQAIDIHAQHVLDPKSATMERQKAMMGHMEQSAMSMDKCMAMMDTPEDGQDDADNLDSVLEKLSGLQKKTLEIYVGKVLSSKTKEAILSCMKNLQALLDAAEQPAPSPEPVSDDTQALTAQREREQQLRELELAFV